MDYVKAYTVAFADPNYASHGLEEPRYAWSLSFLHSLPEVRSVLDVGCGRGTLLEAMQRSGLHVIGADLKRLHSVHAPTILLDLATTEGLQALGSVRVDAVTCTDVLEHVPEYRINTVLQVLAEVAEYCVVSVANHSELMDGREVHLIQKDATWWRCRLAIHFEILEEATEYDGRLYMFRLKRRRIEGFTVSIVMATYNKASELDACLQSVFSQETSFNIEVVVVDDGSTDLTASVAGRYPVKYAYLDRPYYCNPAKARNVGLRMATGDVALMQCEVVYESADFIHRLVSRMEPGYFELATVYNGTAKDKGDLYVGQARQRPFFFCGTAWMEDMYAVGGNDEDFVLPGYDDDWLAQCLIRGRGLLPRYHADLVAIHQSHERPGWIHGCLGEMGKLFDKKMKAGVFTAAAGPWF